MPEQNPQQDPNVLNMILDAVKDVRERMVTRDQFTETQRGVDRRFEQVEKQHAEWEAESKAAHASLDTKISGVREYVAEREEKARESRSRVWLAMGVIGVGLVAPRVWEVLSAAPGGTP